MEALPNSNPQTDWRLYIENAPLYTRIAFSGEFSLYDDFYCSLTQIEIFCPRCGRKQFFNKQKNPQALGLEHTIGYGRILSFDFSCVEHSCDCTKSYFVYVEKKGKQIVFTKCGEYPSLNPHVDKAILKVFPDDEDLLNKAVKCLKRGYGVGAFAYLRQVLESHIGLLITEIEKMAQEQEDTETLEKLAKLRGNGQMSKNIDLAKNALPVYLRVKGFNPLGLLYRTLSEGIHNQSDEECLKKANDIYNALTFILSTLANFSDAQNRYKDSLKSLSRKENVSAAENEAKNRDDKI